MIFYFFCFILSMFFSFLFWFFSFFFGKRVFFDLEKNSPFECGFDPILSSRIPFSMRFFLLAVLFLVFDVEIVLLMPISLVVSSSFFDYIVYFFIFFLFVLLIGLFHEWNEGSLDWVY